MTMSGERLIRAVLIANVCTLAAFIPLGHWLLGAAGAVATIIGAALAIGNLLAMSWLVRQLLFAPANRSKRGLTLLLGGKLVIFGTICWVAVRVLGLDIYGFALGFSSTVAALLVGAFWVALIGVEEISVEEETNASRIA